MQHDVNSDFGEIVSLVRQPLISTERGQYLYSDANRKYEPVTPLMPDFSRSVSNIESFIAYVVEEADRRSIMTGKKITVTFNDSGGFCRLVDGEKPDGISYNRTLSPQWLLLRANLDRQFTHPQLLRLLQQLRPSFFDGYEEFMRAYRRVTFDASVAVTSQPFIKDGQSGSAISFQFSRTGGGDTQAELPAAFLVKLPFARGSQRQYTMQIEIDSELRDKGDKKEIVFTLQAPDLDNTVAEAIKDELDDFKEALSKKLPDALIVLNF